ncbi:sigma-70 family RNA polymerase sigma factor [Sphingobacterium alkalisoli]|uniref:Sigma-70 family RNA polymerase sigma factor n=1 Tax=Sphingobacterium alkalisoli TaxID=1874115 RepID=A0A4U0H5H4_9SPHI|nr:sigma-70 family RNA polymerase sigma factor [Sphingobacterium alkalisoli]TJY66985.1 sigma-70 family RNA polymerase sigma factor [Sphingobacterium alkalisoli]
MSPIHYLEEKTLISLLQNKDQRAFNYLYDNYAGALYGVIIRIVRSKTYADEVIQDVFVKIWNHVDTFDATKGRLYTWMINIARNVAIDCIKSKGVQNEQKNQSLPNIVDDKEKHNFTIAEDVDFIGFKNVLNELKTDWKLLIEMAYFEGYTQQEIAVKLDIPIGTVKTRTRGALLELKRILKEYQ